MRSQTRARTARKVPLGLGISRLRHPRFSQDRGTFLCLHETRHTKIMKRLGIIPTSVDISDPEPKNPRYVRLLLARWLSTRLWSGRGRPAVGNLGRVLELSRSAVMAGHAGAERPYRTWPVRTRPGLRGRGLRRAHPIQATRRRPSPGHAQPHLQCPADPHHRLPEENRRPRQRRPWWALGTALNRAAGGAARALLKVGPARRR
jgi:hypothetical protein